MNPIVSEEYYNQYLKALRIYCNYIQMLEKLQIEYPMLVPSNFPDIHLAFDYFSSCRNSIFIKPNMGLKEVRATIISHLWTHIYSKNSQFTKGVECQTIDFSSFDCIKKLLKELNDNEIRINKL